MFDGLIYKILDKIMNFFEKLRRKRHK